MRDCIAGAEGLLEPFDAEVGGGDCCTDAGKDCSIAPCNATCS